MHSALQLFFSSLQYDTILHRLRKLASHPNAERVTPFLLRFLRIIQIQGMRAVEKEVSTDNICMITCRILHVHYLCDSMTHSACTQHAWQHDALCMYTTSMTTWRTLHVHKHAWQHDALCMHTTCMTTWCTLYAHFMHDSMTHSACTQHAWQHDALCMYTTCMTTWRTLYVHYMYHYMTYSTCTLHVWQHDALCMYTTCMTTWCTLHVHYMYDNMMHFACTLHVWQHDALCMCTTCICNCVEGALSASFRVTAKTHWNQK